MGSSARYTDNGRNGWYCHCDFCHKYQALALTGKYPHKHVWVTAMRKICSVGSLFVLQRCTLHAENCSHRPKPRPRKSPVIRTVPPSTGIPSSLLRRRRCRRRRSYHPLPAAGPDKPRTGGKTWHRDTRARSSTRRIPPRGRAACGWGG